MMRMRMMQIQQEKYNEIHIQKWSENEPALAMSMRFVCVPAGQT